MEKLTYNQLFDRMIKHNEANNITTQFGDPKPLYGVVVFKDETFKNSPNYPEGGYSLEARSYRFRSDNKRFISWMMGNSIFAKSLDGSDEYRLDYAIFEDHWKVDYCYIEEC